MSGGVRTFKLVSGGYADVPEDQLDSWMQEMDANGVQFEDAKVSADMQVGQPEVLKSSLGAQGGGVLQSHGASGTWGPDEDMGFMDRFAGGAKELGQSALNAGEGFVRGLNQSLYQGGADEFAAAGRAAGGEDFGSALQGEQAARDKAWNDTPVTYGAGRALGYVPGMMLGGPAGAGIKAALGRVGTQAGMAGANGFLSSDGDLGERAKAAGRDAAIAAPFAGAGEAMMSMAPALDQGGIAMRRANAGGSAGELNATRLDKGLEHMQTGLDENFDELGLADSLLPQSAYGVAKRLGGPAKDGLPASGMIGDAGQRMGGALDGATDAGLRGSWDSVRGLMDNSIAAKMGSAPAPTDEMTAFASQLGGMRDQLPQGSIPMNQAPDLDLGMGAARQQRIPGLNYEDPPQIGNLDPELADPRLVTMINAQRARGAQTYTPPTPDAIPQGNLGNPVRQQSRPTMQPEEDWLAPIKNAADEATPRELQTQKNAYESQGYPKEGTVRLESDAPRAGASRAAAGAVRDELGDVMSGTDFYPDFNQGRETIEQAAPIAAMAGNRAAANKAGSSVMNPIALGAGLSGAGAGFLGGGMPGAVAGGVMGFGANALARNYGQDVVGMGMRGGAAAMGGGGQAMQNMSRAGGGLSSMLEQGSPTDNSNGLAQNTRGFLTPDAAKQMLQQDPMAFGPYTQQFQQAMQSNDPSELVRLLDRLEVTDQRWQKEYLPMLHQQTGQMEY